MALVIAGQQHLANGEPEAALEAFRAALSNDPQNRDAANGVREAAAQVARKAQRERERARRGAPSPPPTPPGETPSA